MQLCRSGFGKNLRVYHHTVIILKLLKSMVTSTEYGRLVRKLPSLHGISRCEEVQW